MRKAYALLGLLFIVVFILLYVFLREEAEAPSEIAEPIIMDESVTSEEEVTQVDIMALTLTSPAFEEGGAIPSKFTCDGEDILPELNISGVPEGTETLVLLMDDPDAPGGTWAHWAVYNIPPETTSIPEGTEKIGEDGKNSWNRVGYGGPCPPDGEHRYAFRLYALSGTLNFIKTPTLDEVEEVAKGMAIESATLMGRYSRVSN